MHVFCCLVDSQSKYHAAYSSNACPDVSFLAAKNEKQHTEHQKNTSEMSDREADDSSAALDELQDAYSRDRDDILNPQYRLLSSVPRAPTARVMPRYFEPASAGRSQPPGPGAYHTPVKWGDAISTRLVPHSTNRSVSPRGSARPTPKRLDIPYYDVKTNWSTPSGAMTFRAKDNAAERSSSRPGPGVYNPTNNSIAARTDVRQDAKRCTFGVPHRVTRRPNFPGPGTYGDDAADATPSKSARGAVMTMRAVPPSGNIVPGPGSYALPGAFTPGQGKLAVTMKARLPHPMDDHLAMHETAKSSVARPPEIRHRAKPRLK